MRTKKYSAPIKFGVVGLGGMGVAHCRMIAKIKKAALTAVCDADAAHAREIGELFNVPFFSSAKEMACSGVCDVALIATPHPHHAEPGMACLENGLHLICEKPLTERISTARMLVETARRRRRALAVMLQCRLEPAFVKARSLLTSGRLGEIRRAEMVSSDYRTQAYYDSATWRGTWRGEGGGVLLNQAPHLLDQFTALAGAPIEVVGRTATITHKIEVENNADALLRFKNGAFGYVSCSTTQPGDEKSIVIWTENATLRYSPRRRIEKRLELDWYQQGVSRHIKSCKNVWDRLGCRAEYIKVRDNPWGQAGIIENMVQHLLLGKTLACSGADALHSLELANAIALSSWLGKPVTLPIDERAYDRRLARLRKAMPLRKDCVVQRLTDPRLLR